MLTGKGRIFAVCADDGREFSEYIECVQSRVNSVQIRNKQPHTPLHVILEPLNFPSSTA